METKVETESKEHGPCMMAKFKKNLCVFVEEKKKLGAGPWIVVLNGEAHHFATEKEALNFHPGEFALRRHIYCDFIEIDGPILHERKGTLGKGPFSVV